MKQRQVLKTIFPEVITENFEFVDYQESADRLDYWLDERGYMSREDYKKGTVREYGFTDERMIQDFPIRSKARAFLCQIVVIGKDTAIFSVSPLTTPDVKKYCLSANRKILNQTFVCEAILSHSTLFIILT